MPTPTESCATCRFYLHEEELDEPGFGTCRRYPPMIPYMTEKCGGGQSHVFNGQPDVQDDQWCGEYQPR